MAYLRSLGPNDHIIEAWTGGPCITTGQLCPIWQVRKPDGTGMQTRGSSMGHDLHLHPELRKKTEAQVLEVAVSLANEYIQRSTQ
jgi:hypothetical protein